MIRTSIAALAVAWLACPALAQEASDTANQQAEETLVDADMSQGGTGALTNGERGRIGNVSVSVNASGVSLVVIRAEGIPQGLHGIHLHMVGVCEGPTFESAGEHIADGHDHGIISANGPHPGDLPNVTALSDGTVNYEAFAVGLTEDLLFDADGSALIIHAERDDYFTQPTGGSGDRIACAVIEPGGAMAPSATDLGEGGAVEDEASGG